MATALVAEMISHRRSEMFLNTDYEKIASQIETASFDLADLLITVQRGL